MFGLTKFVWIFIGISSNSAYNVKVPLHQHKPKELELRMSGGAYILSFTGASLSLSESIKIAEVYLRLRDWEAVKAEVKDANLIQARTQSSIQRAIRASATPGRISPNVGTIDEEIPR
jgi:hypothetical protein